MKIDIPKIRFKDFSGKWSLKSLGDLGSFMGGGTPSTANLEYWKGNIPWISSSDLFEDDIHNINVYRYVTDDAIKESATKIIPKNSVLLISRVGVGKLAVNRVPLCTSQDFANFVPNASDSFFIAYTLSSKKKLLTNFSQGTSIKGFTISDAKSVKIFVPSLPEQQKIASFLSTVDEKIQQLTRKRELLEQYKKGVMQQLFSGKLRFKDENGKPYPKWEEKKLGDVGKIRMCKRIFSNQTTENGDVPFYKIGTFGKIADAYISRSLFNDFKEKYPYPKVGDILMSASGTLGRTVVYDGSDAYFQDSNIVWIENNEELVTNAFLFYIYQVVKYKSEGGTIQRLYNDIIKRATFLRPSLSEQQKIASFLSALDAKIESGATQIAHTQTFKKGLLQQMFV